MPFLSKKAQTMFKTVVNRVLARADLSWRRRGAAGLVLAGPASAVLPPEYSLTEPESLIDKEIVVNRKRISLFSVFSDTQLLRRRRRRCSHGGDTSGGGTMMLEVSG